ncbi:MAG: hypothetical protein OH316_00100 [Candidatus Parvarchaeota archaeon]|nr:hypothetical protein [Candidatus Parvarchaeota archaeon]
MVRYALVFSKDIREEAHKFYMICHRLKRWHSNVVLIVLDACLTSSGLNYFNVVVPRVEAFYKDYMRDDANRGIDWALSKRDSMDLLSLFNNKRIWGCFFDILSRLSDSRIKGEKDMETFKRWAVSADYKSIDSDPIGMIKGVGINTFQYLRMQAGVDTIMPDKIIKRWIENYTGKKIKDEFECIDLGAKISKSMKVSPIELCWAVWIKESDERGRPIV